MNLFVTGTDTGIGKTVVSTVLALKFGYRYWKPIQSGLEKPTDTDWVADRIGWGRVQEEAYRLKTPVSPHASARVDETEIDLEWIVSQTPAEKTIIEGCGGVLVPLNETQLVVNLISRLECPVILVARSGLGTINHTLLSLEALRARRLSVLGIILVGESNQSNREAIERFGDVPVIGQLPILSKLDRDDLAETCSFIHFGDLKWK